MSTASPKVREEIVAQPPENLIELSPPSQSKPVPLPALTGMRAFFSLNILFFHFNDPKNFGWLAPAVSNGYIGVTFFFLLSGFVLGYNYGDRAESGQFRPLHFYKSRLARLYPVYLLGLLISLPILREEWTAHTHSDFWLGLVLTPLMLQGWHPTLMNFWNTPAWTLSCEVMFYLMLPWLLARAWPRKLSRLLWLMAALWLVSLAIPALYYLVQPDGVAHPDRYTYAFWVRGVRMWPVTHLPIFIFGILLSRVQRFWPSSNRARLWMAVAGVILLFLAYESGNRLPYLYAHNGLLAPLSSLLILGMAGRHWLSRIFSWRPLVRLGMTSYCLYLLHFNTWIWLHATRFMHRPALQRLDPWLSYLLIIAFAYAASTWVERPGRHWMERVMGIASQRENKPPQLASVVTPGVS